MSLNIGTLPLNSDVVLTAPDGYKIRGTYKGYLPAIQRHEFTIKIGNGDGTKVLFNKDTFTRYTVSLYTNARN